MPAQKTFLLFRELFEMRFYAILTLLLCLFSSIYGFSPCTSPPISSRILTNTPSQNARHIDGIGSRQSTQLFGGKQAKFGIFSPAVYGAKLGEGVVGRNTLKLGVAVEKIKPNPFCSYYYQNTQSSARRSSRGSAARPSPSTQGTSATSRSGRAPTTSALI